MNRMEQQWFHVIYQLIRTHQISQTVAASAIEPVFSVFITQLVQCDVFFGVKREIRKCTIVDDCC